MKLKDIFKGACLIAGLTLIPASCSMDYDPLGQHSELTEGNPESSDFKDKAAVESHMQLIYKQMKDRQEHWYMDLLLIAESHSDNAYAGTTGAEVVPFENNSIEGSNSVLSRDWTRYMEDVGKANKIICTVDNVKDDTFTTTEREVYKAQSKIFRAMIYFDMVRIWGRIPLITDIAGDITSENVNETYPQYFPAQSDEAEVYKLIEKDLLEALEHAPAVNSADKTLFTKAVAHTLLAKIYAEKPLRDYDKVIEYADKVAAAGFDLADDYSDLFGMNDAGTDAKARNTKESILEAQFFPGGRQLVYLDVRARPG